jgi:hypothetical protein
MKWSELPKEYQELEKGFDKDRVYDFIAFIKNSDDLKFRFSWSRTMQGFDFWEKCHETNSISELPPLPTKDEKLELLKEIQEYFERKENERSMPLWLSVRIEKVINQ